MVSLQFYIILFFYVRSARFDIIEKYMIYKLETFVSFFIVIQMTEGTLAVVIRDVVVAVVLMSEVVNKRSSNYCLNYFYFRHNGAMCDAI